jgi:hypothetical protein
MVELLNIFGMPLNCDLMVDNGVAMVCNDKTPSKTMSFMM